MTVPYAVYIREHGHPPRRCKPFCNQCKKYPNARCPFCGHVFQPLVMETSTMEKTKATQVLDVPVSFGRVSIGEGSVSIPIKIDREHLNPEAADGLLCGCRVKGEIAAGQEAATAAPDRQNTFEIMKHRQTGMFEIKGYSVAPKAISATLNVLLKDVKITEIVEFAKHDGRLRIESVAPLEEDA